MKKNTSLLLLFFTLFSVLAFAQNTTIDSIRVALGTSKNDIDRVQLLNAIAVEYQSNDPKLVLEYGNKALQLSQKIKFRLAEGTAYLNIGNGNIILGNYPEALRNFSNAQSVFEKEVESNSSDKKEEIKKGLARAYGSIGIVFSEQSSYTKALQYHLKAVKIYEESNDLARCARVYNNIGIVYKAQGEDFKALNILTVTFLEDGTLQGKMNNGTFTAKWAADGKDRTLTITQLKTSAVPSGKSKELVEALSQAAYYKGDSKYLKIAPKDKKSYVQLGHYPNPK